MQKPTVPYDPRPMVSTSLQEMEHQMSRHISVIMASKRTGKHCRRPRSSVRSPRSSLASRGLSKDPFEGRESRRRRVRGVDRAAADVLLLLGFRVLARKNLGAPNVYPCGPHQLLSINLIIVTLKKTTSATSSVTTEYLQTAFLTSSSPSLSSPLSPGSASKSSKFSSSPSSPSTSLSL
jgi:hypothetical protein